MRWLALILPTIVGTGTEEFLQENVLKPLGMNSTTYYPFSDEFKDRLMPLRFGRGAEGVEGGAFYALSCSNAELVGATGPLAGIASTAAGEKTDGIIWEELKDQLDLLKLPRK
jgi:CubicO group peptidase (beta-lactamase class C family)